MASPQSLDAQQQVTINALASGWSTLPASKQEAAKSLVDWFSNKGFLTFKQWEFAHSLAANVKPGKPNLNVQVNTAKPDGQWVTKTALHEPAPHADELMGVPNFTIGMEEELDEIEAMRLAMVGNPIATIHDGKLNWQSGDPHAQYPAKVGAEIAMADVKHHVKPGPALLMNEEGDFVTDPVGTQLQKVLAGKDVMTINRSTIKSCKFSGGGYSSKTITFTVTLAYAKGKGLTGFIDKETP